MSDISLNVYGIDQNIEYTVIFFYHKDLETTVNISAPKQVDIKKLFLLVYPKTKIKEIINLTENKETFDFVCKKINHE